MIQNFNPELELKHKYSKEEFSHHYTRGNFSIFLKADAKNNLFKIRYVSPNEFESYFENIASFIQDRNLDDLIRELGHLFYSSVNCKGLDETQLFRLDVALLHMKEALYLYRGDLRSITNIDSDSLICRCMGIDQKMFKDLFIKNEGKKVEILKDAQISMICGECSPLVNQSFSSLVSSEELFEGEKISEWRTKITALLGDFHFYSPKEFQGAQLSLVSLNFPEIEINLKDSDTALTEKLARTSLANYLGQELGMPLNIKISFDSFSSTH